MLDFDEFIKNLRIAAAKRGISLIIQKSDSKLGSFIKVTFPFEFYVSKAQDIEKSLDSMIIECLIHLAGASRCKLIRSSRVDDYVIIFNPKNIDELELKRYLFKEEI